MTLGLSSRLSFVFNTYRRYRRVGGHWYSFPGVSWCLAKLILGGPVLGSSCYLWWATLASMLIWIWPNFEFCVKTRLPDQAP